MLNYQERKVFPNNMFVFKIFYLASENITKNKQWQYFNF